MFEPPIKWPARIWRTAAMTVCLVLCIQPDLAQENMQGTQADGAASTLQLWQFKGVNDVFTSGRAVYLDITSANGTREFWNPVTGEFKPRVDFDARDLSRPPFIPGSPEKLSNGGTIVMSIESTGARCGYTVGVNFTYTGADQIPATFYLIEKYKSIKRTFYCGTPLQQRYDVEVGNVAVALSDGRLLIVDFAKKQGIAFTHVPSTIVALDDQSFLVPASFLKPGLDAAGDNQGARYRALLRALESHPVTVVRPVSIE